jgi:hypothetical protein
MGGTVDEQITRGTSVLQRERFSSAVLSFGAPNLVDAPGRQSGPSTATSGGAAESVGPGGSRAVVVRQQDGRTADIASRVAGAARCVGR